MRKQAFQAVYVDKEPSPLHDGYVSRLEVSLTVLDTRLLYLLHLSQGAKNCPALLTRANLYTPHACAFQLSVYLQLSFTRDALHSTKFSNGSEYKNFLGKYPKHPKTVEFLKCEPFNRQSKRTKISSKIIFKSLGIPREVVLFFGNLGKISVPAQLTRKVLYSGTTGNFR